MSLLGTNKEEKCKTIKASGENLEKNERQKERQEQRQDERTLCDWNSEMNEILNQTMYVEFIEFFHLISFLELNTSQKTISRF